MPVVSNTSPLLNLALIDELRLVREQLGDIIVPPSVVSELRVDSEMPGAAVLRQAFEEGWLRVEQGEQRAFIRALRRELDAGEAEAIVLAMERDASLLLIDELEGRRVARRLGIETTGVLGILLEARQQGRIDSLRAAFRDLRSQAGYWVAPALANKLLRQAGER